MNRNDEIKRPLFLVIISVLMGISGLFLNLLSLVYFVKHQNKGLSNRLLITLITTDSLFCLASILYSFLWDLFYNALWIALNIINISNCVTTVLLSVVRAISITYPLYQIRQHLVWAAVPFLIVTFGSFTLYIDTVGFQLSYSIIAVTFNLLLVLVVTVSSIVSVRSLRSNVTVRNAEVDFTSQANDNNRLVKRRATITIVALSVVFCITTSIVWIAHTLMTLVFVIPSVEALRHIGSLLLINSTVNPLIYLVRKRELRDYVIQGFKRVNFLVRRMFRFTG